jgi:hypothetical protein
MSSRETKGQNNPKMSSRETKRKNNPKMSSRETIGQNNPKMSSRETKGLSIFSSLLVLHYLQVVLFFILKFEQFS